MFLLKAIDLIALLGLLTQAFVAWVFVVVLATMRRGGRASKAFDSFHLAFIALALALTAVCLRFFMSYDIADPRTMWVDGAFVPRLSYVAYQGLKGLFGLLLVRGSYALVGRRVPRALAIGGWIGVGLLTVSPLAIPDIEPLLLLQAPAMIVAALLSLHALSRGHSGGIRPRVVAWALWGLAGSWCVHAASTGFYERFPGLRVALSLNSFVDLGVQLALGTGLIIGLLEENHRRLRLAEQEREDLERRLERDERLRSLGTLVSGVAHELNNPLTVILGYADLIGSRKADAQAARIVAEQAERCRGIVRNLSALAGQSQHPKEELDVAELLERVLRGMDLDPATIRRVEVGCATGLCLFADRIGMEQVLANLIGNALQADPAQGPVRVLGARTPDGISVSVADQGAGVPREIRTRLFEPFFTTKGPGKGTGLGLSIAHAIVRAHGGTITVADGPGGRGALFTVHLPHGGPASAREVRSAAEPGEGRTLLVIDDEPEIRSVLRLQAESRGWRVREAESAERALALGATLHEFDAILCDLCMPGLGGAGLHDHLERHGGATLDRTVFFTGNLASEDAVRFSRRTRRPLVPKPCDMDELFALLSAASPPTRAAASA